MGIQAGANLIWILIAHVQTPLVTRIYMIHFWWASMNFKCWIFELSKSCGRFLLKNLGTLGFINPKSINTRILSSFSVE